MPCWWRFISRLDLLANMGDCWRHYYCHEWFVNWLFEILGSEKGTVWEYIFFNQKSEVLAQDHWISKSHHMNAFVILIIVVGFFVLFCLVFVFVLFWFGFSFVLFCFLFVCLFVCFCFIFRLVCLLLICFVLFWDVCVLVSFVYEYTFKLHLIHIWWGYVILRFS